ncbi:hypothetical protein IQ249_21985 [Lusitaniella coriacea LEGE 07157]|uniref:Uncharacterized protein n=1 Tax=Lusitaniella coriacea LEGE 07157 TaxID=945747 RepID=A0A8J7E1K6_9CYAN|nr:hypothetical protein [Lusitaniella coriacea]MBE9118563.1 hypothetical protein [Lusitaniella coriacea LEGE 07157]
MIKPNPLSFSSFVAAIALILGTSPASATPLTSLPDGDYSDRSLTLRKSGSVVIGVRSRDSICFRGRLVNGRMATGWDGPVFGDRSGNFRRRFWLNFDTQFPINANQLTPASQVDRTALNRCTDIFRPIVNLGINVGMADSAVQSQLRRLNWRRTSAFPNVVRGIYPEHGKRWRDHWNFDGSDVTCDGGGNLCVLTWQKGDVSLSVLLAVGLATDPPVVEICVTDLQSFNTSCQFSRAGDNNGYQ